MQQKGEIRVIGIRVICIISLTFDYRLRDVFVFYPGTADLGGGSYNNRK